MSTMVHALATRFRTCEVTGLKVDWHAETLLKVNAVVAVVNFLIGIIAAFGIVMTRWQAVHLLPVDLFYRFLTLHGLNMLIFFIIFFEMAILYFAGPILLKSRLPAPRVGWLAFGLMVLGMVVANVMVLQGNADVLFTSYPPLQSAPALLPGHHPLRGGRPRRDLPLLRHARRGQAGADVRGIHPARELRRADRGHHRGDHAAARGGHLHPHAAVVARISCTSIPRSTAWSGGDSDTRPSRSTWPPTSRSGTCSPPSPSGAWS